MYYLVDQPYPHLLMVDINWSPQDLTSQNCLTIMASLPPFFFLPNMYELKSFYL